MTQHHHIQSDPARRGQGAFHSRGARARRRALLRRRRRQARILGAALITLLAGLIVALALRGRHAPAQDITPAPTVSPAPTATAIPSPTPSPTPAPTATAVPTPEPSPTPRPIPDGTPDVISFYTRGHHNARVRLADTVRVAWKKGKDIGSFEAIASDAETLQGKYLGEIIGNAWTAFPASDQCKIGYTLSYTLKSGEEIHFTMLSPKHVEHTEYIECWLYDDYHVKPNKYYSHLRKVDDGTLITSIKLTCGPKIDEVEEIRLTTFVCTSLEDFDADRNYIGSVSRTVVIQRK